MHGWMFAILLMASAAEEARKSPAASRPDSVQLALNAKSPQAPALVALNADSPNLPDRPLTLVKLVKPIYPDAARAEALAGAVQMEVNVDEDGAVDAVKTLSGHPKLAEAAATAIRRWTYQAAVVGGKPVRSTTVVKLNFKAPEQ